MYINCKENTLFIPKESMTSEEMVSKILEGIVNLIHFLFSEDKAFILIITMDSNERKDVSSIPMVDEF